MKQITIRGIPVDVARTIEKEAKKKQLSLNKAIIALLEKATGIRLKEKEKKILYHDLDHLCGIWTKEEAATFKKSLELQRKIDEELWKKTG